MRPFVGKLFLAVAFSSAAFYLFEAGFDLRMEMDGNRFPAYMALVKSQHFPQGEGQIPAAWNSRQLACVLSGRWFDFWNPDPFNWIEGRICFGAYHATWFFLTLLLLLATLESSWLPMFGVTAGIFSNSFLSWPPLYLPWDMPAMFFFTLACLLFDRGWVGLLLPVVLLGGLFKETVLCCSLLILLGAHWDWKRRLAGFLAVNLATFGVNRLFMAHYGMDMQTLTMNNATT